MIDRPVKLVDKVEIEVATGQILNFSLHDHSVTPFGSQVPIKIYRLELTMMLLARLIAWSSFLQMLEPQKPVHQAKARHTWTDT